MPDHIHILIRILPKYSISEVVGYLKSKIRYDIYAAMIKAYIQNRIKEELESDQMSLIEYVDPFTGEPIKKNKK